MSAATWIELIVGIIVAIAGGGAIASLITIRKSGAKLAAETESITITTMRQTLEAARTDAEQLRAKLAEVRNDLRKSNDLIIEQASKISKLSARVATLEAHTAALERAGRTDDA